MDRLEWCLLLLFAPLLTTAITSFANADLPSNVDLVCDVPLCGMYLAV